MTRFSDIYEVIISDVAIKQLQRTPIYIKEKLYKWIDQVKILGLFGVKKINGYHDEPLKGKRTGEHSIRLNNAYRAIYVIQKDDVIKFVNIKEVSKHEY